MNLLLRPPAVLSLIADAHHGDIVKLFRLRGKAVDPLQHGRQGVLRACIRICVQCLEHAVGPEKLAVGVARLRHPIRIDEEAVPRRERKFMLPVGSPGHRAERERVPVQHQLILPVGPPERRMLMPRVGRDALPRGELDGREPDGHKKVRVVGLAELVVDVVEGLRRTLPIQQMGLDEGTGDHHEQRGGDPLAGDVRHHQADMVLVRHEEIIEIAAHG